jgi:hypothetical protein
VGGAGFVYNMDFDPGTTGEWIGLVVVPEPGQMALLAAAAFALFGKGKGHESIGLIFCGLFCAGCRPIAVKFPS